MRSIGSTLGSGSPSVAIDRASWRAASQLDRALLLEHLGQVTEDRHALEGIVRHRTDRRADLGSRPVHGRAGPGWPSRRREVCDAGGTCCLMDAMSMTWRCAPPLRWSWCRRLPHRRQRVDRAPRRRSRRRSSTSALTSRRRRAGPDRCSTGRVRWCVLDPLSGLDLDGTGGSELDLRRGRDACSPRPRSPGVRIARGAVDGHGLRRLARQPGAAHRGRAGASRAVAAVRASHGPSSSGWPSSYRDAEPERSVAVLRPVVVVHGAARGVAPPFTLGPGRPPTRRHHAGAPVRARRRRRRRHRLRVGAQRSTACTTSHPTDG